MGNLEGLDTLAIAKAVIFSFIVGAVIGATIGFAGFWLAVDVLTTDVIENSTTLHGIIFCLGLIPDVVCGYLAAMFAGRNEIAHGVVAGIAMLAISGLSYFLSDDDPFTFMHGLALFLEVPLAVCGAFICKRTK